MLIWACGERVFDILSKRNLWPRDCAKSDFSLYLSGDAMTSKPLDPNLTLKAAVSQFIRDRGHSALTLFLLRRPASAPQPVRKEQSFVREKSFAGKPVAQWCDMMRTFSCVLHFFIFFGKRTKAMY